MGVDFGGVVGRENLLVPEVVDRYCCEVEVGEVGILYCGGHDRLEAAV